MMGNDELSMIAAELIGSVQKSATIDWAVCESARAKIRLMVRRIMEKYVCPADLQAEATSWDWSRRKRYARIGGRMTCDLHIASDDSGGETSTSRLPALQVDETFGRAGMDD